MSIAQLSAGEQDPPGSLQHRGPGNRLQPGRQSEEPIDTPVEPSPDTATCPSCGHENPADARFCSQCASSLVVVPPARKERKFATALFADLVGSTALTEREDPEVVQAVIGRLFDRLAGVIERHGGFLEKYMGDAILAVFGVPVVHEDDPERAIRASLEMHGVLAEMNRGTGHPPLEMRIGVEAGDVVVDLERVAGSRDRMLTGDAVNTAVRLQSAAGIGAVLVGPTAHSLTKDRVDFSEPEVLELKGKSQPVPAYTALRLSAKHAGERPSLGFESRMVGRDEELAVLQQTLHRVESEGRPALVTIFGPAGSGKSRLVRELLRYLDDVDQTFYWRAGRCLPYGAAAYSGLADAIKNQCEVLEDDPADVVAAKVQRAIDDLDGDAEQLTAIEHLLGLTTESTMGREQLFELWRRFLEQMAARYPLVLVLEDIHWADEGLLDFIEFVSEWALGGILILTLARPELLDRRSTWGEGKSNYTVINVDPLGSADSSAMVTGLLGEGLSEDVIHLITEPSEGNPLYTEEIVRMFIERGVLTGSTEQGWHPTTGIQDIEVPRSIHSLIAARLDGLPADEKTLLQDVSVVGRIFWSGIAAQLSDQDEIQTHDQLKRLRVKELITSREPSSLSDEGEFSFHHALIRDVAYESLPKQLRAAKHSTVARWAETARSEDREDMTEMIATHYERAVAYMNEISVPDEEVRIPAMKALEWSTLAAEHSEHMWQTAGALAWYQKAAALAEKVAMPDEGQARLWANYAWATMDVLPPEETLRLFEEGLELFGDSSSTEAGLARARLGRVLTRLGEYQRAEVVLDEALEILRKRSDRKALAMALAIVGQLKWWEERVGDARIALTEALALARAVGDLRTVTEASVTLATVEQMDCNWDRSLSEIDRALASARETRDLGLLIRAYNNAAASRLTCGDPDGLVLTLCSEGLNIARRHEHRGLQATIETVLSIALRRQGKLDEAVEHHEKTIEEASPTAPRPKILLLVSRAWTELYRGNLMRARAYVGDADSLDEAAFGDTELYLWKIFVRAEIERLEGAAHTAEQLLMPLLDDLDALQRYAPAELILSALRVAVEKGDRDTAMRWRKILDHKPTLIEEAFQPWCDGILSTEPEGAADLLADAAARLRGLHLLILEAVCLIDLARVEKELGRDHVSTLEPVIAFLRDAGAQRYLAAAEAVL